MAIRDSFKAVSRRSFFKVAAGASAVAVVGVPTIVTLEHRSEENGLEHRVRRFLEDQLTVSTQYIFDQSPGANPQPYFINTLAHTQFNVDHSLDNIKLFDAPVVSFASATDPFFDELKKPNVVGPNHLNPREWLPGAKTVISFFYPFTEEVRATNRQPGLPSRIWLAAKAAGETFVHTTNYELTRFLAGSGATSIVPDHDPRYKMARYGDVSAPNWSERHIGYVVGLGTFGLHKSLITAKGSAGRLGSIITIAELIPSGRAYKDKNAYCPYFTDGSCDACVNRCPGHAVNKNGENQAVKCARYCKDEVVPSIAPVIYRGGCGKCMNAVPCESGIPQARNRQS